MCVVRLQLLSPTDSRRFPRLPRLQREERRESLLPALVGTLRVVAREIEFYEQ